MEQYVIKGGNPLVGEVEIGGAKNAALAILAAATMTDETVTIENLPDVRDTNVLMQAMEEIGVHIDRIDRHTVKINAGSINDLVVLFHCQRSCSFVCHTITPLSLMLQSNKFVFVAMKSSYNFNHKANPL